MKNKLRATRLPLALCCGLLVLAAGHFTLAAAQDEEKGIRAEEFLGTRPAINTPKRNTPPNPARYKTATKLASGTNVTTPPEGLAFAQVGVTTWRLRKSTSQDKTKELIEGDDEEGKAEYTLERVQDGAPLAVGQRVRLSIESLNRDGYLYVIDREQYEDGSFSDPLLIFPSSKNLDANRDANKVKAGRLISIPSGKGRSFQLKPRPGDKRQVAELITILVAPTPLVDPTKLGAKPYLPARQVAEWEKKWGATPTKFELEGGLGQAMTENEQTAGANATAALTQDDPGPQTVYRVAIKPENPVLLSVPLKLKIY
ncbi:MAG TPA: hypothetical protein VN643_06550 [Pyrinomonadaceae bacterium]|nr:hypothetical protein [Pyrinomonadaceae bacterium]